MTDALGLAEKVNKFNQQAMKHLESQSLNPFSDRFSRSPSPRPKFNKDEYGKPVAGSKTDLRGKKAFSHISREIVELCECIYDVGKHIQDPDIGEQIIVSFGELFSIYSKISDKVVGLLIAAKKRGYVYFEPEILFQRRDDDVLIALVKPLAEIKDIVKRQLSASPSPAPSPPPAPTPLEDASTAPSQDPPTVPSKDASPAPSEKPTTAVSDDSSTDPTQDSPAEPAEGAPQAPSPNGPTVHPQDPTAPSAGTSQDPPEGAPQAPSQDDPTMHSQGPTASSENLPAVLTEVAPATSLGGASIAASENAPTTLSDDDLTEQIFEDASLTLSDDALTIQIFEDALETLSEDVPTLSRDAVTAHLEDSTTVLSVDAHAASLGDILTAPSLNAPTGPSGDVPTGPSGDAPTAPLAVSPTDLSKCISAEPSGDAISAPLDITPKPPLKDDCKALLDIDPKTISENATTKVPSEDTCTLPSDNVATAPCSGEGEHTLS